MAKYLLLIYGDEQQWAAMTAEEWEAHGAAHGRFVAAAGERILGSGQLQAPDAGSTLRAGNGDVVSTDGPFLETKEAVGGYYLLQAADRAEAEALARLLPEVRAAHSGVEIRPLVHHG